MRPQLINFLTGSPVQATVHSIQAYPYHWHQAMEIILVLGGAVSVDLGGRADQLQEGDIIVIGQEQPHRIQSDDGSNRLLVTHLNPVVCKLLYPGLEAAWLRCSSAQATPETSARYRQLRKQLLQLVALLWRLPQAEEDEVTACLESLLQQLASNFDFLRFGWGAKPFSERIVQRYHVIYRQLRQLPGRQGLQTLADQAGVSLQHLSSDIRARFGLTFQDLLSYLKCQQAVRLLLGSELAIGEIAVAAGFSDPKYLIKHFKRHYRLTPSRFRRLHQADLRVVSVQLPNQGLSPLE